MTSLCFRLPLSVSFPASLLVVVLTSLPLVATAHDRHRHEHKHHGQGGYKETVWEGTCRVEREFKKNGEVKEKRTCRPEQHVVVQPVPVVVVPAPVLAPVSAPAPGVVIQGSVRLP